MGVSKNGRSVIAMLPMKGGKTTLFSNLIKDKDVEIISDDTPIVTSDGHIHFILFELALRI